MAAGDRYADLIVCSTVAAEMAKRTGQNVSYEGYVGNHARDIVESLQNANGSLSNGSHTVIFADGALGHAHEVGDGIYVLRRA